MPKEKEHRVRRCVVAVNAIRDAAFLLLTQQVGGEDALEALPDHLRCYFLPRRNLSSPKAHVPLAYHCRYHNGSGCAVVLWLPSFTWVLCLGLLAPFSKIGSANLGIVEIRRLTLGGWDFFLQMIAGTFVQTRRLLLLKEVSTTIG